MKDLLRYLSTTKRTFIHHINKNETWFIHFTALDCMFRKHFMLPTHEITYIMITGMRLYRLYGLLGHLQFSSSMKTLKYSSTGPLEPGHSQMFMSITKVLTFTTFTSWGRQSAQQKLRGCHKFNYYLLCASKYVSQCHQLVATVATQLSNLQGILFIHQTGQILN